MTYQHTQRQVKLTEPFSASTIYPPLLVMRIPHHPAMQLTDAQGRSLEPSPQPYPRALFPVLTARFVPHRQDFPEPKPDLVHQRNVIAEQLEKSIRRYVKMITYHTNCLRYVKIIRDHSNWPTHTLHVAHRHGVTPKVRR